MEIPILNFKNQLWNNWETKVKQKRISLVIVLYIKRTLLLKLDLYASMREKIKSSEEKKYSRYIALF